MKEEREAFSKRLAEAMRAAGYEPRPSVLSREFNLRYRGEPITFQSASRWLNGRSLPGQDKLQVLARLLGVEPHALRYGGSTSRIGEPRLPWDAALKPHDREAVEGYLALPAQHRKLVRELIAALAS
ncbi:MAG: transcriptional regulator [Rhodanobacteraceae bacterium]|jgi:transcriptional regulator with XRE-family HTH domain|nr:transcriptional regulator [Rhodanobacteraceae bacterium]